MLNVFKYAIDVKDSTKVEMPKGAKVLSLQVQHGTPFILALVDPHAEKEVRSRNGKPRSWSMESWRKRRS